MSECSGKDCTICGGADRPLTEFEKSLIPKNKEEALMILHRFGYTDEKLDLFHKACMEILASQGIYPEEAKKL